MNRQTLPKNRAAALLRAIVAEQLAHPNITVAYPLLPETIRGSEAFKQVLASLQTALPDIHGSVDEVIAEARLLARPHDVVA